MILLLLSPVSVEASEGEIVREYCLWEIEARLPDRTRVDCLGPQVAWEYDYAHKDHEALGQALHYAAMTDRQPGVMLILRKESDQKYVERLQQTIKHWRLPVKLSSLCVLE